MLIPFCVGVDYHAREVDNMRLDVEFEEGEITKEEHARCRWSADDFAPEGGRIADPRTEGPGIRRPRGTGWRIRRAQLVLNRGGQHRAVACDRPGGPGRYALSSRDLILY